MGSHFAMAHTLVCQPSAIIFLLSRALQPGDLASDVDAEKSSRSGIGLLHVVEGIPRRCYPSVSMIEDVVSTHPSDPGAVLAISRPL
jgi:hypothetical protein